MRISLVLALLSSAASAQTFAARAGASLEATLSVTSAPGGLSFSVVPALSVAPALSAAPALAASLPSPVAAPTVVPALAVAPALALSQAPLAAAATSDERPKPGSARAADELGKRAAEFERLVSDLTGGDKAKSAAAVDALMKLKEQHLNSKPDPKTTRILDLKPMQIPVGMLEVQDKARELRDMKDKQADAWLLERSVPIIEDYKGRKRPVDHHHEARAAWEADHDDAYSHRYFDDEMHDRIKALPRDQFYAVTRAMGLFYDRDQFGAGPHDPNHLPEDVRSLADDPYRSIAGAVRKRGGYTKSPLPFAEFLWANYFRERIKTYPTKADFDKSVTEALAIVHDAAAKNLPGYKAK